MAKFDIIEAVGRAYMTTWQERRYLLRLAAVPFLIQLACLAAASTFADDSGSYLRFSLIMVPAWLAEGWMLCHYVRLLVMGERWPFVSTGDRAKDFAIIAPRARGVLAGLVVYALVHMLVALMTAGVATIFGPYMPSGPDAPPPAVPGWAAFVSIVLLVATIWGIRLVWLYIPVALNGRMSEYFARVRGGMSSLYMAGLWLLCLMPFVALVRFGTLILAAPAGQMFGAGAEEFTAMLIGVIMDMAKGFVVTAGMVFALKEVYGKATAAP